MRILGIDPGLRLTGYGCIQTDVSPPRDAGASVWARPRLVEAGVLRLRAARGDGIAERLAELDDDLRALLRRLAPDAVAVESLFAHYRHPATAIAMGHARGVILLAVRRAAIPLAEFKPNMVKKSLTGHGHAGKEQVQRCIRDALGLAAIPRPPDVADALAIALCAAERCWPAGSGAPGAPPKTRPADGLSRRPGGGREWRRELS